MNHYKGESWTIKYRKNDMLWNLFYDVREYDFIKQSTKNSFLRILFILFLLIKRTSNNSFIISSVLESSWLLTNYRKLRYQEL